MTSPQSRAMAAHWQSLKAVAGESVVLSRGASTGNVVVVPAETGYEQEAEEGQTVRMKQRDFLIGRADFEGVIGENEKPRRGDSFVQTVAGMSRTYEAVELAGEVYRWFDKSGQVLRIHTIETGSETTTTTTEGA